MRLLDKYIGREVGARRVGGLGFVSGSFLFSSFRSLFV
jgi:hypothetical protein